MVIDHCTGAAVNETISSSTEDRSKCDFRATAPGSRFLLSVSSAVQLGGRVSPDSRYPTGLASAGFQGCIKNFIHNGEVC
jgi:Laminin G domain